MAWVLKFRLCVECLCGKRNEQLLFGGRQGERSENSEIVGFLWGTYWDFSNTCKPKMTNPSLCDFLCTRKTHLIFGLKRYCRACVLTDKISEFCFWFLVLTVQRIIATSHPFSFVGWKVIHWEIILAKSPVLGKGLGIFRTLEKTVNH